MSEPMIPRSMHDSAVEAARAFGRREAEQEALRVVARIVDAAGGTVTITDKAMVEDDPVLFREDDVMTGTTTYFLKR